MFCFAFSYVIIKSVFDSVVQEVTYGYRCVHGKAAWYAVQ